MSDLDVTGMLSRYGSFLPFREASEQRPISEDTSEAPISGKKPSSYVAMYNMYNVCSQAAKKFPPA